MPSSGSVKTPSKNKKGKKLTFDHKRTALWSNRRGKTRSHRSLIAKEPQGKMKLAQLKNGLFFRRWKIKEGRPINFCRLNICKQRVFLAEKMPRYPKKSVKRKLNVDRKLFSLSIKAHQISSGSTLILK